MAGNLYAGVDPDSPTFEIVVDDPGHGRLHIRRLDGRHRDPDAGRWGAGSTEFAGTDVGLLLDKASKLVAGTSATGHATVRGSRGQVLVIEADEAAFLLPVLTRAVLLAVAGQERYERVATGFEPQPPRCVNCGAGSFSTPESSALNGWCLEYGHSPFGTPANTTWDQAERDYATRHADLAWSPIKHEHESD